MKGWLFDTNVVSEFARPAGTHRVLSFVDAQGDEHSFISIVTLAELRFGIERLPGGPQRSKLESWLDGVLRPAFSGRVIAVDEETLLWWRRTLQAGRRRGHTFAQPDLLIAACATLNGLVVATCNTSDFIRAGVPVYDPWTATFFAERTGAHDLASVPPAELLSRLAALH